MLSAVIALTLIFPAGSGLADRLGVMISDRPSAFVDLGPLHRPFQRFDGQPAKRDAAGWPAEDGYTVMMDDRAIPAWNPPLDDPAGFQPEESGTYTLAFNGKAEVDRQDNLAIQVQDVRYDPAKNLTTAAVLLPKGAPNLIVLTFRKTQRTPDSAVGTGITGLRFLRPGYPLGTTERFTQEFLRSLAPFKFLRFMGWQDTNYQAGYFGDVGHHILSWKGRTQMTDPIWGGGVVRPEAIGYPIELYIDLCNRLQKDLWLCLPIAASSASQPNGPSYALELAKLIKNGNAYTRGLSPNLKIYIEHSNEVWNFGFSQYIWNKLAAIDEVKRGNTTLNNDGVTDEEQWTHRRHGKRLYEIAKDFEQVFGPGSLNRRVMPVYAAWTISPEAHYTKVLDWMAKTYGPLKNYFHSISITGYFNEEHVAKDATVSQVLDGMDKSIDGVADFTRKFRTMANQYGLQLSGYECGPDNGGGSTVNIGNRILANRDPRMGKLITRAFKDAMFGNGMDYAVYFAQASAASRYGCWGAVEDLKDLNTPKYRAILVLVSMKMPAPIGQGASASAVPTPSNLSIALSGNQVRLSWDPVPGATYTVWYSTGGNFNVLKNGITQAAYQFVNPPLGRTTYYVTAETTKGRSQPSNGVTLEH